MATTTKKKTTTRKMKMKILHRQIPLMKEKMFLNRAGIFRIATFLHRMMCTEKTTLRDDCWHLTDKIYSPKSRYCAIQYKIYLGDMKNFVKTIYVHLYMSI